VKQEWTRAIVHTLLAGLAAGCSASPALKIDDIPVDLRVAAGAVLAQQAHAAGVQIYRCSADKSDAARFSWTLKAPEADLFDRAGNKMGKHYAGPTWEANDGSRVMGEVVARTDSPDPKSVAWLLLRAKSASGKGVFGSVLFIQRLRTAGGSAPTNGCDQASGGNEVRAPYTAEYWFYVAAP
jgi:hypothetical protein